MFSSIVGHGNILRDLARVAHERELRHSYLFWGAPRVGKKTAALLFARHLEGEISSVLFDGFVVEPDEKGVISIDRAREIKNFLSQKPLMSAYRTVVVDQSHRLTPEAQQALLKVTEGPPDSSLIILITHDPEALLPTLVSRCQKIYFPSVSSVEIERWLVREHGVKEREAAECARRSFGQPGRAFMILRDEKFQEMLKTARALLELEGVSRSTFIKNLVRDEEFRFQEFLDALIEEIALQKKFELWHAVLALRRHVEHVNLNPRLQLESMFQNF